MVATASTAGEAAGGLLILGGTVGFLAVLGRAGLLAIQRHDWPVTERVRGNRHTYRHHAQLWMIGTFLTLCLGIFVGQLFDWVIAPVPTPPRTWSGGALAIILAITVLFVCAIAAPIFRAAVIADGSGVVIRNYFRTRRLAWQEVARFERGSGMAYPKSIAVLRDGSRVKMLALDPTRLTVVGRGVQTVLDTLNERIQAVNAAAAKSDFEA